MLVSIHTVPAADEFDQFLKPFFTKNCVKCHGGEKVKGKVNLKEIANVKQFLVNPELIKELIEVIDAADMPCLLYTSPSPRDRQKSRMPSSA